MQKPIYSVNEVYTTTLFNLNGKVKNTKQSFFKKRTDSFAKKTFTDFRSKDEKVTYYKYDDMMNLILEKEYNNGKLNKRVVCEINYYGEINDTYIN